MTSIKKVKGYVGQKFLATVAVSTFKGKPENPAKENTVILSVLKGTLPYRSSVVSPTIVESLGLEVNKLYKIMFTQAENRESDGTIYPQINMIVLGVIDPETITEADVMTAKVVDVLAVNSAVEVLAEDTIEE